MKILLFTEGTIIMHKTGVGHIRAEIVQQVQDKDPSVKKYASYVPIGKAIGKVAQWAKQGAEILYLTSRRTPPQIEEIRSVLKKYHFPRGKLLSRAGKENYKDVVERIVPALLIEDDCESIGAEEITITHVNPKIRKAIKSILVKEFGGIDHLPDKIQDLLK